MTGVSGRGQEGLASELGGAVKERIPNGKLCWMMPYGGTALHQRGILMPGHQPLVLRLSILGDCSEERTQRHLTAAPPAEARTVEGRLSNGRILAGARHEQTEKAKRCAASRSTVTHGKGSPVEDGSMRDAEHASRAVVGLVFGHPRHSRRRVSFTILIIESAQLISPPPRSFSIPALAVRLDQGGEQVRATGQRVNLSGWRHVRILISSTYHPSPLSLGGEKLGSPRS
ncbi:predicted protein [Uncinocarpus reesii 1704]|uniref:Uncharacterized protein n=1 Tax=Uncinocarpus reesii (strain UAMH 1704) TaxID=336963 RepID=C4JVW8_UNCRE|nr:uncharacterized protein UREG_06710 [Uncinocarpus reesii 1704]EEP81845.1 predicted protein [Uncinocarpus reesii 1704]